jgi:predicted RNase H-like HicB family nuclease
MEYTAIIRKTDDGWYAARCAQIPEAITQGRTIEEVKENLLDAINMVLELKKEQTIGEIDRHHSDTYFYQNFAVL